MNDINKKHKESKEFFLVQVAMLLETEEWSDKILKEASSKCKFPLNYHLVLFPNGLSQIISELERWQDTEMLKILKNENQKLKIREKIARALEVRLLEILPKICILKQKSFFISPANIIQGLSNDAKTCDLIWRYAGDKSDDFYFYTKRGLLMGAYSSARLFYVADESKNFVETRKFIRTTLNDIINIASIKNKIKFPKLEDIPILRMFS